ncbi:MAG: hypothetical protein JST39_19420, partial [Bacteroidetes bacterium]|nr:hypothetical protein [Bacteroidota bacterium]
AIGFAIISIPEYNVFAVVALVFSAVGGAIFGSPMIIVFSFLIKVFTRLPYEAVDKLAWLGAALVASVLAFWAGPAMFIKPGAGIWIAIMITSSLAVLAGFWWSKKSILALNTVLYEEANS